MSGWSDGWMDLPSSNAQVKAEDAEQSSLAKDSSKDFVQKLFTMLEEPAYKNIVHWSTEGDSFVVLDAAEFTKIVLPRHFKHSNFASFVRQLNKYDFHKVRASSNRSSVYGDTSWEFKHPDFQLHNRDQLDKIKRKAPGATRRGNPSASSGISLDLLYRLESDNDRLTKANGYLTGRVDNLEREAKELAAKHQQLQRSLNTTNMYMQKMLSALAQSQLPDGANFASLLDDITKTMSDKQQQSLFDTQPSLGSDPSRSSGSDAGGGTMTAKRADVEQQFPGCYSVLLAEEDEMSLEICRRMLVQYGCTVDIASDGLEAVQRAETTTYDLILINTILPQLDGVSSTELIRHFDTSTPIIAMTVGQDGQQLDSHLVESYRSKGVTMILAKPFTKSDLYGMLSVFLKPQPAMYMDKDIKKRRFDVN